MQWEDQQHRKNREAEESHARKTVWGWDGKQTDVDDEMGHTVVGDITTPTPVVYPPTPQNTNVLAIALAGLLGAGLVAAGPAILAAWNQQPAAPVDQTDETMQLRLGRIEDYLQDAGQK